MGNPQDHEKVQMTITLRRGLVERIKADARKLEIARQKLIETIIEKAYQDPSFEIKVEDLKK